MNTGTVVVNCHGRAKAFPSPQGIDNATLEKLVNATVSGVQDAWEEPMGKLFQGLGKLQRGTAANAVKLRQIAQAIERNHEDVQATLDRLSKLDQSLQEWRDVEEKRTLAYEAGWQALAKELQNRGEDLEQALEDLRLHFDQKLEEQKHWYSQALDQYYGYNKAVRLVGSIGMGAGGPLSVLGFVWYSHVLWTRANLAIAPGVAVGYDGSLNDHEGGYAAPPDDALIEKRNYKRNCLWAEVGPVARCSPWKNLQFAVSPGVRYTYTHWEGPANTPSATGRNWGAVLRVALDFRLMKSLVVGVGLAGVLNLDVVKPVWTYTGFGGVVGPGRDVVELGIEGGIHFGVAFSGV
ncbi:MAG: hypothetical protein JW940_19910 [Polyangiaceae bacterium]|nr:hypothetical protein [Polyangiaceae bacterium]